MNRSLKNYYLISIIFFISIHAPISVNAQNAKAFYKKAVNAQDAVNGISLAKKACSIANAGNEQVIHIQALNLIAEIFWREGINDSAGIYGQQALRLGERYHIDSLKADSWSILGLVDYKKSAYKNALIKYQYSIELYSKENNPVALATTYKNIGICERKLSMHIEAITHFLISIKTFEKLKDSISLASVYNSVALCFVSLKNE